MTGDRDAQAGVQICCAAGVGQLSWTAPDTRNAMTAEVCRELAEAVDEIAARKDISVLVVQGGQSPFCSGWDTTELAGLSEATPEQVREFLQHGRALVAALVSAPQIVLAEVRGYALGFGCAVLARCDVVVAAQDSSFGLPEVRHGLPPATALAEVLAALPPRAALRWAAVGDRISADQARVDGLVTDVVAAADLTGRVEALTAALVAHPRSAATATKSLTRHLAGLAGADRTALAVETVVRRLSGVSGSSRSVGP